MSGCTTGLFLGNEFWPSFLCNFVTTNKSSDSVTETIPQCNSTSHRPTLMVDLKMVRFGQCPLFHLPVFKILVKGLGPFWFFGGPSAFLLLAPSGPWARFCNFSSKKKKKIGGWRLLSPLRHPLLPKDRVSINGVFLYLGYSRSCVYYALCRKSFW